MAFDAYNPQQIFNKYLAMLESVDHLGKGHSETRKLLRELKDLYLPNGHKYLAFHYQDLNTMLKDLRGTTNPRSREEAFEKVHDCGTYIRDAHHLYILQFIESQVNMLLE